MGVRRTAGGQRQLRMGAALPVPPRAARHRQASSLPTAPCRPTSPARARIRKNLIEADLVDCIVALPGQLFRSTQIPACLWFLSQGPRQSQRRGWPCACPTPAVARPCFIDARKPGRMGVTGPIETLDTGGHSPESPTPTTHGLPTTTPLYHWERVRACPGLDPGVRATPTFPASARAQRCKRFANMATYSLPAATSAPSRSSTSASPSRRRWRASQPQWRGAAGPKPNASTRPSRQT